MKRQWILVGVIAILGASFLIDYFAESQYPEAPLVINGVPDLSEDSEYSYRIFKNDEEVGTHRYMITDIDSTGASKIYTINAYTQVTQEGKVIELENQYVFDESYCPISYRLNVTQDGEVTQISSMFTDNTVTTMVTVGDSSVTLENDVSDDTLLIENGMPGFWELLFQSTDLEPGYRYNVDAYIPQAGGILSLTLVVNRETSQVRLDGGNLEVTVVSVADLDLVFYLYEDELVLYRDDNQEVVMRKVL
ncbi:MAG: hypothetical protein NWE89_02025 [Candidatus Bathyarchaeota archaeon]|nr:hypothetical protein [Candidatus Bathyarchaeota archaeon]